MSTTEPSLLLIFLSGGLGSVVGYFVRKVQKYEDRRDEIYLVFLPSLNYGISSLIEAVDIFLYNSQLQPFIEKIKNINIKLEEQRLSGEMLFFELDFREKLANFNRELSKFQVSLEKKEKEENASDIVKYIIQKDEELGGVKPSKLQGEAKEIQGIIESKIREFRSLYLLLILAIVIFILGAAGALIEHFKP